MQKSKSATVHPIDDRLFVRRQESKESDTIAIPDMVTPSCYRGRIAAMGPGMPTMTGERMQLVVKHTDIGHADIPVNVGDGVIYSPEHATEITMESGKFDILHFRDVLCVLKEG